MTDQTLIFGYVVVLLGCLTAIAIFYEQRRKRFEPEPSEDHIFRCEKCSFVYTDDPDVERSMCPQCGTVNEQYRF
jgi:rubrerythrin